jgi:pyruvate ferredoxin oxidoreductase gamma subunit/2-oxoisovalerate ferredoxin oxidoreductase gamma subunit
MIAIRFHGRGGQGAVIASKLLAAAFFREGWQVQAFPSFGAERTGVPVSAFLRIDHARISSHYNVYEPDHVVVLDPVLLKSVDVTTGLREGGWIVVNSPADPGTLDLPGAFNVAACDATAIALAHGLGSRTMPIVNTAMAGAFAAVADLIQLQSIVEAIPDVVPVEVQANQTAAIEAFDAVRIRASAVRITWA